MKSKALWVTRTAAMMALLIVLQWLTKPLGQIVTGSCVNAVLAVTVLPYITEVKTFTLMMIAF